MQWHGQLSDSTEEKTLYKENHGLVSLNTVIELNLDDIK